MKLSLGRLAGIKAVSDKRRVIATAAMDQRGSLQKALAEALGLLVSKPFKTGLLLAYEKTGYDKTGYLTDLRSVRRLKEAGAGCVKVLLYYTPRMGRRSMTKSMPGLSRIGDECRANDIPFFLEFVGYEEGIDEKSWSSRRKSRRS